MRIIVSQYAYHMRFSGLALAWLHKAASTLKKHSNSLTDDATPGTSGIRNESAEGSDSVPGDTSSTV